MKIKTFINEFYGSSSCTAGVVCYTELGATKESAEKIRPLLVASPDLLAACKKALPYIRHLAAKDNVQGVCECLGLLNEAIAKAESK